MNAPEDAGDGEPWICVTNANGRQTLLARNYRGDIPMSAVEKFPVLLSDAEEESSAVPPCFSHEGINVRFICDPRFSATRQ